MLEPNDADRFVQQVMAEYLSLTGLNEMRISPADYAIVDQWERSDMPLDCALHGLRAAVGRSKTPGRFRLAWADGDVQEAFSAWQRATGPWRG